jgi:hypothetical protein
LRWLERYWHRKYSTSVDIINMGWNLTQRMEKALRNFEDLALEKDLKLQGFGTEHPFSPPESFVTPRN